MTEFSMEYLQCEIPSFLPFLLPLLLSSLLLPFFLPFFKHLFHTYQVLRLNISYLVEHVGWLFTEINMKIR
jgi:hypothetical protein